ncbi:hypothetical protein PoB_007060300 [Plakobranchus ocellatus]|uniref:Uncharacterized protein n=1 Tax=Plakobranchus ocellatus TaxID=259542 RepID=A0AAV4DIQ2_9GAST|nr:hypothetical protein PoB_007060300 [Plakobranchus ocellatus]
MANYLIMPYAKNNQDLTPGSSMLGLSMGPTFTGAGRPSIKVRCSAFYSKIHRGEVLEEWTATAKCNKLLIHSDVHSRSIVPPKVYLDTVPQFSNGS